MVVSLTSVLISLSIYEFASIYSFAVIIFWGWVVGARIYFLRLNSLNGDF